MFGRVDGQPEDSQGGEDRTISPHKRDATCVAPSQVTEINTNNRSRDHHRLRPSSRLSRAQRVQGQTTRSGPHYQAAAGGETSSRMDLFRMWDHSAWSASADTVESETSAVSRPALVKEKACPARGLVLNQSTPELKGTAAACQTEAGLNETPNTRVTYCLQPFITERQVNHGTNTRDFSSYWPPSLRPSLG